MPKRDRRGLEVASAGAVGTASSKEGVGGTGFVVTTTPDDNDTGFVAVISDDTEDSETASVVVTLEIPD